MSPEGVIGGQDRAAGKASARAVPQSPAVDTLRRRQCRSLYSLKLYVRSASSRLSKYNERCSPNDQLSLQWPLPSAITASVVSGCQ